MAAIAPPPGALPVEGSDSDPFAPTPADASHRHRYAGFDTNTFSLYSNGSPAQAKRALEAHLEETERRLQEASQLGSALVKQRSDLAEKLKEVQQRQDGEDIGPELRQKLMELEREFNEVGKETARAFIPKSRVSSSESAMGTEGVLEAGVRDSPSKVQPPSMSSRKQRNQAPARMNDIKLATDISSSLLNQVRDLQAAYAEKDDALKHALANKSKLEVELEGLMGRLRALDESEQRYKDENWTLETRVQELVAAAKTSSDKETKLSQHVNATKSEKADVERELEELKQAHGKLSEDHTTTRKQHEAEIIGLKKNANSVETERATLQRKVDELTSQNQELAKAMAYKLRSQDPLVARSMSPEDDDMNDERVTPENSPPPSPTKGTPRHGALESETLKSSLHHAHRMIQNLKNNIHREKTEKLELRRMLQDARDELEQRRNDQSGSGAKKRKSRDELKEFKKPARPDRLGGPRGSTTDVLLDEDWEDHDGVESPTRAAAEKAITKGMPGSYADTTDAFETENSDAFETATEHERGNGTETDDFHTGAESLDSEELTETEALPAGAKKSLPSLQTIGMKKGHERSQSYRSTASTSGDEFEDVTTPIQSLSASQKLRARLSRNGRSRSSMRASVIDNGTPGSAYRDSPASMMSGGTGTSSNQTTPAGPSLFAEIGDLSDEDDSVADDGTPSRSLYSREVSPEITRKASTLQQGETVDEKRPEMVEHGMMTEPWESEHKTFYEKGKEVVGAALAGGLGFGLGRHSNDNADAEAVTEQDEPAGEPASTPVHLSMSEIVSQDTEPIEPTITRAPVPVFATSAISSQDTAPQTPQKQVQPPTTPFSISHVIEQYAEHPESPSVVAAGANLAMSSHVQQQTEPSEGAEIERPSTAKRISDVDDFVAVPYSSTESSATQTTPKNQKAVDRSTPKESGEQKSSSGFFGMLGLGKSKAQPSTMIAEDETSTSRQPLRVYADDIDSGGALPGLENARTPFKEIEPNAVADRSPKREGIALAKSLGLPETSDEGTQTLVSAEDLEKLLKRNSQSTGTAIISPTVSSPTKLPQYPPKGVYASNSPRKSRDSIVAAESVPQKMPRRPGSSGSVRSRAASPPPLPPDHKQAIAAAAQKSSGVLAATPAPSTPGQMGPPVIPAAAYKATNQYRPTTAASNRGYGTVSTRVSIRGAPHSGVSSPVTRRSSVSSFASEIDQRFNITRSNLEGNLGFEGATDPRMIQAITQTMIGEFLWKYTRKPGRETHSSTRHRRFFWVHPYTRTLYWSEQDPASAGRSQLKAKSVSIQAVRVVSDDNPFPPGLHRKSLVVVTPGREIMFTAATSGRHETWFNALSYLLLRTGQERTQQVAEETNGNEGLTEEDVDEFNPQMGAFGGAASKMSRRSRASLSSYNSRTTTISTPANREFPTLTPNDRERTLRNSSVRRSQSQTTANRGSISGRLSSLAGSVMGGSFSSRYNGYGGQHASQYAHSEGGTTINNTEGGSIYDASVVRSSHDSAEDLRRVIERQEREADRLENVRACCDGKHDVSSLSTRGRHKSHRHSSPVVQRSQTVAGHSRSGSQPLNGQVSAEA